MKNLFKRISAFTALAVLCVNSFVVTNASAYTPVVHEKGPYSANLEGDWDLITSQEEYKDNVLKVFDSVYPRLYKRWGGVRSPKTVTFNAANDDTAPGSYDTTIDFGVGFANDNPNDIGCYAHELTHMAESYEDTKSPILVYPNGKKTEWWVESLASYGGFRYFHWTKKDYIQIMDYKEMAAVKYNDDGSVKCFDWLGKPNIKGDGGVDKIQWFFAWMDYYYPTTKNENGKIVLGLIDAVNKAIQNKSYSDDIFVDKTGCTMFELMEKYTKDVNNKNGWRFTGFANYKDNWLTEDIDGVENPEYPTNLNESLDLPLMGNFDHTYSIKASKGFDDQGAANLFDNDINSKFCTDAHNPYVIFAMNQPVTVTSYTLTTGDDTSEYPDRNPESWKLYGSNDKNTWNIIHSVSQASRTMEAVDKKAYKFITENSKSYQYYKLKITSSFDDQTIQLSELSLNGNLSLMDNFGTVIDATEGSIDKDHLDEGITDSKCASNLFDGSISTKYCTNEPNPFIRFSMKQPVTVKSYALTMGNDTNMNPESWELYGLDDQGIRYRIDKVSQASNIIKPYSFRQYKFTTNNSKSYKYYILKITSSFGGSEVQLSDFSLYAD